MLLHGNRRRHLFICFYEDSAIFAKVVLEVSAIAKRPYRNHVCIKAQPNDSKITIMILVGSL